MGRSMPVECEHGTVVDWGDFGPCQDCSEHGDDDNCPNWSDCPACEQEARRPRVKAERVNALMDVTQQNWPVFVPLSVRHSAALEADAVVAAWIESISTEETQ